MNRLRWALVCLLLLGGMLSACTDQTESTVDDTLLQFVPADTPYAFVSSRRMPEPLRARLGDHAAMQLASQRAAFAQLRTEMAGGRDGSSLDREAQQALTLVDALLAEFEGRESAAQLRELGIEPLPQAVYFGIGVLPAARVEITDPDAVNAMLDRIEKRAGMQAQRAELGGQAYRRIDLGSMDAVLAVTPTALLAGLLPDSLFDRDLPLLLGQARPAESLADSGAMSALAARHGFSGYGEGFVRLETLVAILLGQADGYNADVAKALGAEMVPASTGCLRLVESLVAGMPRLVIGVSEANASTLRIKGVWEGSDDVVSYLQRVAAPVPGVGASTSALLAMGMGVDLPQLRNGIEALLREVIEQGSTCEWVEPKKIEAVIPQLSLVLGPLTAGIKGFNLQIDNLALNADTFAPEAVEASLLAAVDDPRGVFALGGMVNPALGALEIPMDGTPVELPSDLLPNQSTPPLKVAMRDKALVLLTGDATPAKVKALLDAETVAPPPLFAIDYGVRQLVPLLDQVLSQAADDMIAQGETELAAQLAAQLDDMRAQATLFERVKISVYANAQGLVMDQAMQLR